MIRNFMLLVAGLVAGCCIVAGLYISLFWIAEQLLISKEERENSGHQCTIVLEWQKEETKK